MNQNQFPGKENFASATDQKELVLWDDDKHNLEYKIKTLVYICNISEKESIDIVLDCMLDGSAKITTGEHERLIHLQEVFQKNLITTTIV